MAANFSGQALDSLLISKISDKIGTVKQSTLDEIDFNNDNPGDWYLMDGRSHAGTQLSVQTGTSVIPDLVTEGAFTRQAKADRTVGTFEEDENKSHKHTFSHYRSNGGNATYGGLTGQATDPDYHDTFNEMSLVGGIESRPKNIAVNFYIKVNY